MMYLLCVLSAILLVESDSISEQRSIESPHNLEAVKMVYKTFEPEESSNKSDILLIHGFMARKESFDNIGQKLADKSRRKIYAVDLRNHGDSDWNDYFNFPLLVKDINAFLSDHKITKPVLMGHSLGGRLAMIYALSQDENVDKIIVEDMSPTEKPQEDINMTITLLTEWQKVVNDIPADVDLETARSIFLENILKLVSKEEKEANPNFEDDFNSLKEELVHKNGRYSFRANLPVLIKRFRDLDFDKNLGGIFEGPTFFVYGKLSEVKVGDHVQFILNHFPIAKLHGIEGAGHDVHGDKPEEYVEKVAEFLNNN